MTMVMRLHARFRTRRDVFGQPCPLLMARPLFPRVQLWSFVDNLETAAAQPEQVTEGLDQIQAFCDELDIHLDADKTVCWATDAAARKTLKTAGRQVIYNTRDLGGQMSFCRRHANKVIRDRAEGLKDYWTKLTRSPAPIHQKELSLRVAAWPRALHGVCTIMFGEDHISRLRTRAVRSMRWSNKGLHPALHLSCVSDCRSDPGFHCLQTVLAVRKYAEEHFCCAVLDYIIDHPSKGIDLGPGGVWLQRLFQIGWTWEGQGWFTDHAGLDVNSFHSPIQCLKTRIQHGW